MRLSILRKMILLCVLFFDFNVISFEICNGQQPSEIENKTKLGDSKNHAEEVGSVLLGSLTLTKIDFDFEGTFEKALRNLPWEKRDSFMSIPVPYLTQDYLSRNIKINAKNESVINILLELGSQAKMGNLVTIAKINTRDYSSTANVTYERPKLDPAVANSIEKQVLSEIEKEIEYCMKLYKADMQTSDSLYQKEASNSFQRKNQMLLCITPDNLVGMVIEEMKRTDNEGKRGGADLLQYFFNVYNKVSLRRIELSVPNGYRLDNDDEWRYKGEKVELDSKEQKWHNAVTIGNNPEIAPSSEEVEKARKRASEYLNSLITSSDYPLLVYSAKEALSVVIQKETK